MPGPVNLYACRNLDNNPECRLTVPDYLLIDREVIGLKKVDEVDLRDGSDKYCGIIVDEVTEGSAAEEAGININDVIVAVSGFPIKNEKHFFGLMSQFPATYAIPIELESGDRVRIRVRRLPRED